MFAAHTHQHQVKHHSSVLAACDVRLRQRMTAAVCTACAISPLCWSQALKPAVDAVTAKM